MTGAKIDVAKMIARKDAIVSKMTKGIEFLFRKNKITWLKGHGRFVGQGSGGWQIEVSGGGKDETVEGKCSHRRDRLQGAPPARCAGR